MRGAVAPGGRQGVAAPGGPGAATRRLAVLAGAGLIAGVDLVAKAWAVRVLPGGGVEAGLLDLRLAYNPGVAFGVGADAPAGLVTAITAVVTVAVAVAGWRFAGRGRGPGLGLALVGLTAVLGGAVANLVDRARDGVVTDYLHTGWWPTFNLADTAIVTGAVLLVLGELRAAGSHDAGPRELRTRDAAACAALTGSATRDDTPDHEREGGSARRQEPGRC